mgnify:FL=1
MKKRLFASVLLCSLTLSAIATPSIALADNVDKKIEEKNQEISSLKAKQGDLASQVSSLEAEVSSVFDESMALREQKQTLKAKSEQLQQEITNLNQRIEKRNEAIKNQARDVQVNGQSTTMLDAVLDADSVADAISRVQAVSTIVSANNDLMQQQKEDKQEIGRAHV